MPKRAANWSGLSHWWKSGEAGFCWAAMSAFRSSSWAAVRLKTMLTPLSLVFEGMRPASN